jgi:hypothetical protein
LKEVLKRKFVPIGKEVTIRWIKLHNEEFHTLQSSPDIRSMGFVEHAARTREIRSTHKILVWKPKVMRLTEEYKSGQENNSKTNLTKCSD